MNILGDVVSATTKPEVRAVYLCTGCGAIKSHTKPGGGQRSLIAHKETCEFAQPGQVAEVFTVPVFLVGRRYV